MPTPESSDDVLVNIPEIDVHEVAMIRDTLRNLKPDDPIVQLLGDPQNPEILNANFPNGRTFPLWKIQLVAMQHPAEFEAIQKRGLVLDWIEGPRTPETPEQAVYRERVDAERERYYHDVRMLILTIPIMPIAAAMDQGFIEKTAHVLAVMSRKLRELIAQGEDPAEAPTKAPLSAILTFPKGSDGPTLTVNGKEEKNLVSSLCIDAKLYCANDTCTPEQANFMASHLLTQAQVGTSHFVGINAEILDLSSVRLTIDMKALEDD